MSIRYCEKKYFPEFGAPPAEGITLIQMYKKRMAVSANRDIIADDPILRKAYTGKTIKKPTLIESSANGTCLLLPFDDLDDVLESLEEVRELCKDAKALHVKEFRVDPGYELTKYFYEMPFVVNYYVDSDIPSAAKEYLYGFKRFCLPAGMSERLEWSIVDDYSELLRFGGYIGMASRERIMYELPRDVYQSFIDSVLEGMPSEEALEKAVKKAIIL